MINSAYHAALPESRASQIILLIIQLITEMPPY
jgi:hypothetical protein